MKETFCSHYLNKRIFMLQAIYTVLLRGKLGRNSIMYRYGLCVHIVFCLAGLKLGMSYKWPKQQRWKNKRGERWKPTIFHFCVVIWYHTTAFMFLSYTAASLYPGRFMTLSTKQTFFDFVDASCVVVSLYRWLTWNAHSLQILESDVCTRKCKRNWYNVDCVAPSLLFQILGAPLIVYLLSQLIVT